MMFAMANGGWDWHRRQGIDTVALQAVVEGPNDVPEPFTNPSYSEPVTITHLELETILARLHTAEKICIELHHFAPQILAADPDKKRLTPGVRSWLNETRKQGPDFTEFDRLLESTPEKRKAP